MAEKNPSDLEFEKEEAKKDDDIPGDDVDSRTPGSDIEMPDEFIEQVMDENEEKIIAGLKKEKEKEKSSQEANEITIVKKQRIIQPPRRKKAA